MIELGQKVKDKVTGFTGIVVARTEWLNKCVRCAVQPVMDKEGKIPDYQTFDEEQLEVVGKGVQIEKPKRTGGGRESVAVRPKTPGGQR